MRPADSPFASLRPASGSHPATAELRAYAAGTLAPAEQHRVEAHTLDCARCADLLAGFSLTDAATTDQAVATLRTRLQARLGEAVPAPATAPRWAWPRVAAAAVLLGVAAGGLWTWEHRPASPPAATARLETAQSAGPATSELRPAVATPPPAPAQPVAGAPTPPVAAEVANKPRPPAYAVARPARPQYPAQLRRVQSAPIAAVSPAPASQGALPKQSVSATAPEVPVAPETRPRQLSVAPVPTRAGDAAAPANLTSEVSSAEKAGGDSVASALGAAGADQRDKATSPAAAGTATVRVANTPMPAALAINPAPVGGPAALRDYLRRAAADFKPETDTSPLAGTVRVKFTVGADGRLSNLKVVRGLRADYDSEALRIVCEGPAWQPGVAGGRRAPLPMEVTVPF